MTLRNRISALLARRGVLLAVCALPCAALLTTDLVGRHNLEDRATALRRENLGLEIKQLASSIDQQSYELESAVRAIAESDDFADWALENSKDIARQKRRAARHEPRVAARKRLEKSLPGGPGHRGRNRRLDLSKARRAHADL